MASAPFRTRQIVVENVEFNFLDLQWNITGSTLKFVHQDTEIGVLPAPTSGYTAPLHAFQLIGSENEHEDTTALPGAAQRAGLAHRGGTVGEAAGTHVAVSIDWGSFLGVLEIRPDYCLSVCGPLIFGSSHFALRCGYVFFAFVVMPFAVLGFEFVNLGCVPVFEENGNGGVGGSRQALRST